MGSYLVCRQAANNKQNGNKELNKTQKCNSSSQPYTNHTNLLYSYHYSVLLGLVQWVIEFCYRIGFWHLFQNLTTITVSSKGVGIGRLSSQERWCPESRVLLPWSKYGVQIFWTSWHCATQHLQLLLLWLALVTNHKMIRQAGFPCSPCFLFWSCCWLIKKMIPAIEFFLNSKDPDAHPSCYSKSFFLHKPRYVSFHLDAALSHEFEVWTSVPYQIPIFLFVEYHICLVSRFFNTNLNTWYQAFMLFFPLESINNHPLICILVEDMVGFS